MNGENVPMHKVIIDKSNNTEYKNKEMYHLNYHEGRNDADFDYAVSWYFFVIPMSNHVLL